MESPNYLDQIAATTPKKTDFLGQKPIVIGIILGLAIIISIVLMILTATVNSQPKKTLVLAARLQSIQDTSSKAAVSIKSTQLRAYNSNLTLYLTNTLRDYSKIMTASGTRIENLPKTITNAESNAEVLTKLEDARLNAVFDRTYANEIAYELETTLALMRSLSKSASSKSLKDQLSIAINNLIPIQKQFADFSTIDG